ncbi:hypothetical protein Droror1_Dr00016041 [Drosera rotundifolia]
MTKKEKGKGDVPAEDNDGLPEPPRGRGRPKKKIDITSEMLNKVPDGGMIGFRMLKTLERYQKCSYGGLEIEDNKPARELEANYREYLKLKARYEALQRTQRNLLGEELGPLNVKELDQLERQLEGSLKQIRSIKTQSMVDQLTDLQCKEQALIEANRALRIELDEISRDIQLHHWAGNEQTAAFGQPHAQCQGFFEPLQTGYQLEAPEEMNPPARHSQAAGFIPGWML